MSNLRSALVQFAYYGAYFSLATPAAFVNGRCGYNVGVRAGFGLAAAGDLLFLPASGLLEYLPFLAALSLPSASRSCSSSSAC